MIVGIGLGLGMGSAPAAFSPATLSGLVAWFDAAHALQTANVVTSWPDRSAAANDLPVVSGSPSYSAAGGPNGLPKVGFGGSAFAKRTTSIVTAADAARTMFVVSRASDLTTAGMVAIDGSNDAGQGCGYLLNWDPAKRTFYEPGVGGGEDSTSTLTSAWERVCIVNNHNGGAAGNNQLYVNGVAHAIGGGATSPLAATGGFFIGSSGAATFVAKCDVAEVILYNRVLSALERGQVDTYLSTKYGF